MILLIRTLVFLLGYLFVWGILGIPVFVLCLALDRLVLSAPLLASNRIQFKEGIQHGVTCVQCCGIFMLILLAVGLMLQYPDLTVPTWLV